MTRAKVYLFYSPMCPHCPPARQFMREFINERNDFDFIELRAGTQEAAEKAKEFDIVSSPTFIIQGPAIDYNIGQAGTPSREAMNRHLDIALGIRKESKEKKTREFSIGKFKIKF